VSGTPSGASLDSATRKGLNATYREFVEALIGQDREDFIANAEIVRL
jgi:hypothetical protein